MGFDSPDANTYSALISELPRFGHLQKAVELAEEACTTLGATACGRDRRALEPIALQQLFRSMKQEGVLHDLGVGRPPEPDGMVRGGRRHWISIRI